jgi:MFS family permease
MFQIAAAVGIILGGFIATWSFSLVMWLSVIPQILCLWFATKIKEPPTIKRQESNIYAHLSTSVKMIWSNKKLRLLSINSIIGFAIGESSYQFRSAFVNMLWPLWAVGIAKVLSSVGAALSYWYSSKIIKRYGSFTLLLINNVYSKIINIFSLITASVFSPFLMSTTSLLYGVTEVANSSLMQREFTDQQRATLGSLTSFAGNLAFGVFALFLGYLADTLGPAKALLIAAVLSSPTILINWYLFRNDRVRI